MSSSTRFAAILLLMLCCIPAYLRAQSSNKPAVKVPRGSVSGRVTIKDKPAPGVTVGLRATANGLPMEKFQRGVTDQDGVYHITNVPPGSYEIIASAPAYVITEGLTTQRGKSVVVGEDETVEDINFSMVRGGVITGKITDAEGHPLVQQQVSLYRAGDFLQQPRRIDAANNVQTDDRGIYRFFGLAVGRYKVASGRGDETYAVTFQPQRVIYKQVFHPDATDQTKATIIEVREGSEATGVDIALGAPMQTFSVSGRVVDGEKGLPVPNIRFAFQRKSGERFEIAPSMGTSNGLGDFFVEGLVPGNYTVISFGSPDQESRIDAVPFDVIDADVSGLTVRMIKGSSVSGMVVLEPEDKRVFAKLLELQLRGYVMSSPGGGGGAGQSTTSTIGPDGSFRLGGLAPGQLSIWLAAQGGLGQPKGFTIVRVEQNGVVMPRGIEIKEGDQLTSVRLVVSYGTASIHGSIKLENGTLPDGARMFVRLSKPGQPPTGIGSAPADARGQFLFEGIPPGVYELSVTAFIQAGKPQLSAKREISVQDGMMNEVSITLDLTPLMQPSPQPPKP